MLIELFIVPIILIATWQIVLLSVMGVILVALIALIIAGRKMQKKQEAAEANIENGAQTYTMLIIDKKIMKLCDAGFPEIVMTQTPKYLRKRKVPVVKAKVGPKVLSLMCDAKIFDQIPVKKEIKGTLNGIYLFRASGLRGPLETPKEKPGFFKRLYLKAQKQVDAANKEAGKDSKKGSKK